MNNLWFNIKRCMFFMKDCKKEVIILFILSIIITLISILFPSLNAGVINNILIFNYKKVIILVILIGILEVINTTFNMLVSRKYLIFKRKFILNVRKSVCRNLINFNIDEYYKNSSGSILNKMQTDSSRIVNFFNNIKNCFISLIGNVGIIIYIFLVNKYIGIYYLVVVFLCFLLRYYGVKKSIYYKSKELELGDNNITLLNEVMSGVKDIKTLDLKTKFINKTDDSFEKLSYYEYKSSSCIDYTNKIANFFEAAFFGGMVILSMLLIKNNLLTTSEFVIIYMYKKNVFEFSGKSASLVNYLSQFNLACNRVFSILDYKKEEFGNVDRNIKGNICFKNVSFGYETQKVIKNFNLDIKEKTFVSIVGMSGAGKSTIMKLITKMYSTNEGEILIDGTNINELSEQTIKNSISLVNQNSHLFNFSVKENFEIIDNNFNNIQKVCKTVGMHEKIKSLKNGYDTKIGPDAYILSGGEKQKLSIARALLSKSKIILLDEITSNLDNESSYSIKQILSKLKGKYTIVLVTHDLDMASCSDRVIVIDKGKIVGDGTHLHLLQTNKYYKKFYNINKKVNDE